MDELDKLVELEHKKPIQHIILWASAVFLVVIIVWAYFAKIDEVTHADGKVIPSQHVQVIQNLEGGIVKAIPVKEGQLVEKNQPLIYIDDTKFSSAFQELKSRIMALQLTQSRLTAELNNKPFTIPKSIQERYPDLAQTERALLHSRLGERSLMQKNIELTEQELAMTTPLVKRGSASKVEALRLEQKIGDLKQKLANFHTDALQALNKTKAERQNLQEKKMALQDQLRRTTVLSPVKGIVKQIHVSTIGGVIKPGMDLIEVVPIDGTLLVEAKIRPSDIGFIHQGQSAMIKISAYDYSIYGGLPATITHISADTSIDKDNKNQAYYEIWARTDKNTLGTKEHPLSIMPGMQATVSIQTGKKSILNYLMKPLIKAKMNALTER